MRKVLCLTLLSMLLLSGCGKDYVINKTERVLEETYQTDFSLVNVDYNKGLHSYIMAFNYDLGIDDKPVTVWYDGNNKYFDDYYSSKVRKEIRDNYLSNITSNPEIYVMTSTVLDASIATGYAESYEDYLENYNTMPFVIRVYCNAEAIDIDWLKGEITNVIGNIPYECEIKVCDIGEYSLSMYSYIASTHVVLFDEDFDIYECDVIFEVTNT